MFTARPIVLSLSTLLVPLLASLYLLTENGAELHTREGSTQTLLKHLDEALLDAPWVAFEEAEAYKSHTKSARNAVEGSPAAAAVVRVELTVLDDRGRAGITHVVFETCSGTGEACGYQGSGCCNTSRRFCNACR
mgnify:CR=1 FL=1